MFYINDYEVVEVDVLSKNTSDYHNDTLTYYNIRYNETVKLHVSSSKMYASEVQASLVLEGILRSTIKSKKIEVEFLEGKLVKLKESIT